ncbi:transposase zinc-binding domain-containing protein [Agrobacterium sp. S7/73]
MTVARRRISYNSCRNRHCTNCQCIPRRKWVAARISALLRYKWSPPIASG